MKTNSFYVDPKVYTPDNSRWLNSSPSLKDCQDKKTQVAFCRLKQSRYDTVQLTSVQPNNRLIDEGAIKPGGPGANMCTNYSGEGINHEFLSQSPDFVEYMAKGYANDLNPEAFKGEDVADSPYYGYDKQHDNALKAAAYDYAKGAVEFFGGGEADSGAIDRLTDQFAALIKEYGTQMADGKGTSTADLQTRLTINGVDMTIGELDIATQAIKQINENSDIRAMAKFNSFQNEWAKQRGYGLYPSEVKSDNTVISRSYNEFLNSLACYSK